MARRSIAVKAKSWVLPSFQPRRRKHAEVFRQRLIEADAEAVFQRSILPGGVDIGDAAVLRGQPQRLGVAARIGAVKIAQHAQGTFAVSGAITPLAFEHIAAIAEQAAVEAQAVGDSRLGGARVAQRPVAGMKFVDPSPGVAARIGGIIPSAVVHHRPTHELRSRIVAIAIAVEKIGDGEAPGGDGVAGHRARAGELILIVRRRIPSPNRSRNPASHKGGRHRAWASRWRRAGVRRWENWRCR